jgi:hypothetical protein
LTNALFSACFAFINIKTIYSREKNNRINYNLKILADKEINENNALLVQMMPPHALEYLENAKTFTDRLKNVTLIFADIVGFTD